MRPRGSGRAGRRCVDAACRGRGSAAPGPGPEGSIFVVRGTGGDRGRPCRRGVGATDRGADREVAVDGLEGAVGTRCRVGIVPTTAQVAANGRASRPKPAKLAMNLGAACEVEGDLARRRSPEQICGGPAPGVPRSAGDAGVAGDDLPVSLRAVSGRVQAGVDQAFADREGIAEPVAEDRAAQEPDPEHDQHLRAAARGQRPGRAGQLGGRSDHREGQPVRDRHARGTLQQLHDAGGRFPTDTSRSRWRRR